MAAMQGLVLEVVLIILLTTIFDLMLPEGKLQPLVRLLMGLFVLASLLNPLLQLLNSEEQVLDAWIMKAPANQSQWESIAVQGAELQQMHVQEVQAQYQEKLEEQIKALLIFAGAEEVREVIVGFNQEGKNLEQIAASYLGMKDEALRYQQLLAGYYGLPAASVQIKHIGG